MEREPGYSKLYRKREPGCLNLYGKSALGYLNLYGKRAWLLISVWKERAHLYTVYFARCIKDLLQYLSEQLPIVGASPISGWDVEVCARSAGSSRMCAWLRKGPFLQELFHGSSSINLSMDGDAKRDMERESLAI